MRQDKGGGVTLYRKDYILKCVSVLNTSQSGKHTNNLTKSIEGKIDRTLQIGKDKFRENEYKKYSQRARDQDCFMVHRKYTNYNSSNKMKRMGELTMNRQLMKLLSIFISH